MPWRKATRAPRRLPKTRRGLGGGSCSWHFHPCLPSMPQRWQQYPMKDGSGFLRHGRHVEAHSGRSSCSAKSSSPTPAGKRKSAYARRLCQGPTTPSNKKHRASVNAAAVENGSSNPVTPLAIRESNMARIQCNHHKPSKIQPQ